MGFFLFIKEIIMKNVTIFLPNQLFSYKVENQKLSFPFGYRKVTIEAENSHRVVEVLRVSNTTADIVLLNEYGTPMMIAWGFIENNEFGFTTRYITNEEAFSKEEIQKMRNVIRAFVMTYFKVVQMEHGMDFFSKKNFLTKEGEFSVSKLEAVNDVLEAAGLSELFTLTYPEAIAETDEAQAYEDAMSRKPFTATDKPHREEILWKLMAKLDPSKVYTFGRKGYFRRTSKGLIWIEPTTVHRVAKEAMQKARKLQDALALKI